MEVYGISGKDSTVTLVRQSPAEKFRQQSLIGLGARLQLPFIQRVLKLLKAIISPFFFTRTIRYYESDDAASIPVLNGHPTVHVESYEGISAVPDDVADLIEPFPGETITVIFIARKVAGYVRAAFKEMYSTEWQQVIRVSAGEVYLYDTYILPEYQQTGLYSFLLAYTARDFLRKGFGRVLISLEESDLFYQKTIEKAGFRVVQTRVSYRILWKKFYKTISPNGAYRQKGV